jgi:hypothetical protein
MINDQRLDGCWKLGNLAGKALPLVPVTLKRKALSVKNIFVFDETTINFLEISGTGTSTDIYF